jgi:protein-S-isoprenylcysteine O-methyltransferase Ste14
MTTRSWLIAAGRSVVWLGAAAWLAYLKGFAIRSDAFAWVGSVLLVGGLLFHLWSNVNLARADRKPNVAPGALAVSGPYHYVRNPIYLAGFLLLLGTYVLFFKWNRADAMAAVILAAFFHLRVVRSEEPALRRRFGIAYDEYCRRVPRWIPRLALAGAIPFSGDHAN